MDGTRIVTLAPDEWHRYRALRLEALTVEPRAFAASLAENRLRPEAHWRARLAAAAAGGESWLFFAECADALVGMVGALVKDDPHAAEVIAFFVSPAARGTGVGTALLTHVLAALSRNPTLARIELRVNERQAAAVRLYRRFGFEVVEDGAPPDGYEEGVTLLMRRGLPV